MPLIVIEGLDGSGKSTQLALLEERIRAQGLISHRFRDPGGTALGEGIRSLLLDPKTNACGSAELLGYLLARAQLVHEHLAPLHAQGAVVVLDRFWYSTIAYQCFGLGLPREQVQPAIELANQGIHVDAAIYLDISAAQALQRRADASALDRIESRGLQYLQKVEKGYHSLVSAQLLHAIPADQDPQVVHQGVWELVSPLLCAGEDAHRAEPL
ncbi:MAG: dTMP kinase [Planctomycetota bacterium]|nr:MAG: dTMP kinase [Planctomycetota bacterium]